MERLKDYGCGDSGCIFGSPGGMATNGGCRCFLEPERGYSFEEQQEARLRYRKAVSLARKYENYIFDLTALLQDILDSYDEELDRFFGADKGLADEISRVIKRFDEVL
jgi:hypothetical protein